MKRSFRAATVFTGMGVLAGTVGAVAHAGPARASHVGSIGHRSCLSNTGGASHWVHLFYVNDDHPAECFHNRGRSSANATIYSLCPGNNSGMIIGTDKSSMGTYRGAVNFNHLDIRKPISKYDNGKIANDFHVSTVVIDTWTGEGKCT